jgi:hypothetical protein
MRCVSSPLSKYPALFQKLNTPQLEVIRFGGRGIGRTRIESLRVPEQVGLVQKGGLDDIAPLRSEWF